MNTLRKVALREGCASRLIRTSAGPGTHSQSSFLRRVFRPSTNFAPSALEAAEFQSAGAPVVSRNPNLELAAAASVHDVLAPIIRSRGLDDLFEGKRPNWWWTGLEPARCPGWTADRGLTSLAMPNLDTCSRQEVLDYFDNTWTLTELLFASLQGDAAFYLPPYHQLRHPLVFYYGHPAALYVNKFRLAGLTSKPINALFEQIFETGVDEMSWDDLSQSTTAWPSIREVHSYRKEVYVLVRKLIETHPGLEAGHARVGQDSPLWALFMGFEHERIHLETSSVLMRELPLSVLRRPEGWVRDHPSVPAKDVFTPREGVDFPANPFLSVQSGEVSIGKPREWPSYGWDNEYGSARRAVRPFEASQFRVSNGEFYQFVSSGAYIESKFWTKEGWKWRTFRNAKWPTFWSKVGPASLHQYRLRTLFGVVPMPWSWPAEVNAHEARAFCNWRAERDGKPLRIATEAEHLRIRQTQPNLTQSSSISSAADDPVMRFSGAELSSNMHINANLAYGTPAPVDTQLQSRVSETSEAKLHFGDTMGNVWEWCDDDFHPLEGFKVHPLYDDFSTPCFDGEHSMIMGGSFISTGAEASVFARFHFRPHFFQHAGFRLVSPDAHAGANEPIRLKSGSSHGEQQGYESQKMLDEYMALHYATHDDSIPPSLPTSLNNAVSSSTSKGVELAGALHFPQRCAGLVGTWAEKLGVTQERALDIGCAVGGSTFELARGFNQVVGVDLSASFIQAAQALQQDGQLPFFRRDEGDLGVSRVASVDPDLANKVAFRRADACALPPEYIGFDAVLIANLLCRLPSPRACLGRLGGPRGLVKPGGLVVLVSPYSWMAEHTPKEVWLGGFERDGREVKSAETLVSLLSDEFELRHEEDMPLLLREHKRKYQFIVSHAMVFQRKQE